MLGNKTLYVGRVAVKLNDKTKSPLLDRLLSVWASYLTIFGEIAYASLANLDPGDEGLLPNPQLRIRMCAFDPGGFRPQATQDRS